tara:strand:- start:58 stop:585 length:528 start_codon:yes stop_codon:yes gene_type:complete
MVNIPFVSEAFQRTFRQRFPSQTSTGRDLHVSDIVIPTVDFTPTSEGADLPSYLQLARSPSVSEIDTTTASSGTVFLSSAGFYRCSITLVNRTGQQADHISLLLDIEQSTGVTNIQNYVTPNQLKDELTIFIPPNSTGRYTFSMSGSADGALSIYSWQIASVNGQLNLPQGYNPE